MDDFAKSSLPPRMTFPIVYLASASPRRRELLEQIGVIYQVIPVDVDEQAWPNENARDYVNRIARSKVLAGFHHCQNQLLLPRPILAADTAVVLLSGEILGKPQSTQQATQYLTALSGRKHQVMTCVALIDQKGQLFSQLSISDVTFAQLSTQEIEGYVRTGEGMDKAGSYAVQGIAAQFIESMSGSYSGIMGLPLYETASLLKQVSA